MAVIAALVAELTSLARVEPSEGISNDDLTSAVEQALSQHDKFASAATLPTEEEEPVLTLAWVKVCLIRAAIAAKDGNASGGQGFGMDRNTPYQKNMDMAQKLTLRYATLCNQLKIDRNRVIVGQLFVRDALFDALVPLLQTKNMPRTLLTQVSYAAGILVVRWATEAFDDFLQMIVFTTQGATPLFQEWNNNSGTGIPKILEGAVKLITMTDPTITSLKITGLDNTQTNRVLLVLKSRSLIYGYSNELVVPPGA